MNNLANNFSIQSYVDSNRDKIDESLVSLRLMKQVDEFLDYKNLSNKDLSVSLGYSESYVSQLMSGVKRINTSFINKFEKEYNVKVDFKIYINEESEFLSKLTEKMVFQINVNVLSFKLNNNASFVQFSQKSRDMSNFEYAEYECVTG